jgi:hypothetical protein
MLWLWYLLEHMRTVTRINSKRLRMPVVKDTVILLEYYLKNRRENALQDDVSLMHACIPTSF